MTEQEKSSLFADYFMNRYLDQRFSHPFLTAMLNLTKSEIEKLGLMDEYRDYERERLNNERSL